MFESCWAHHSTRLHLADGETKSRSWRAIDWSNALSERSESKGLTCFQFSLQFGPRRWHRRLHVVRQAYAVGGLMEPWGL